jgi:hypothetical protein
LNGHSVYVTEFEKKKKSAFVPHPRNPCNPWLKFSAVQNCGDVDGTRKRTDWRSLYVVEYGSAGAGHGMLEASSLYFTLKFAVDTTRSPLAGSVYVVWIE